MKPLLILLTALGLDACSDPASHRSGDKEIYAKSVINQPGPELQVEKWISAKPETAGKFVLVDFWATWCPPCRKAIGELNALQKKFPDRLVVIGLSDEPDETVRNFANPKLEYANAVDTKGRTKEALQVEGIPHVIVMDPKGIVRWEGFPAMEGHELTEQVVGELIAKYGGGR